MKKRKVTFKPGDLLSWCIREATGIVPAMCSSCGKHIKQMNKWGWWQCWKKRRQIEAWLVEAADKFGFTLSSQSAHALVIAGFKQFFRHRVKQIMKGQIQMDDQPQKKPVIMMLVVRAKNADITVMQVTEDLVGAFKPLENLEVVELKTGAQMVANLPASNKKP